MAAVEAGGVNRVSWPWSSSSREWETLAIVASGSGSRAPAANRELPAVRGLQHVAGVTRGGRGGTGLMVEGGVLGRVDPDLDRHPSRGGVVALRKREHHGERTAVPVAVTRGVAGVVPDGEEERGDDQACPEVVQH